MPKSKKVNSDTDSSLSYDTKTIIVVITLIFTYPIGLLLMFLWMRWNALLKNIIALPFYLMVVALVLGMLNVITPSNVSLDVFRESPCIKECRNEENMDSCTQKCMLNRIPTVPAHK